MGVLLNDREWGFAQPLANKQLLFCASLIPDAWVGSVDLHVNTHYQVNLAAWLLTEKPIIIDLLVSPWARKRQKHPASLSSARSTSSKRHLDDTVSWLTLGICPSLWTVNESATDDISHDEKPVMDPLLCSSQYQLHLILHRWWWKCFRQPPAGNQGKVWAELINDTLTVYA